MEVSLRTLELLYLLQSGKPKGETVVFPKVNGIDGGGGFLKPPATKCGNGDDYPILRNLHFQSYILI